MRKLPDDSVNSWLVCMMVLIVVWVCVLVSSNHGTC